MNLLLPFGHPPPCKHNDLLIDLCSQTPIDIPALRLFMLKHEPKLHSTYNNSTAWRLLLKSRNTLACQCFLETQCPDSQVAIDVACESISTDRLTSLFCLRLRRDLTNSVIPAGSLYLIIKVMDAAAIVGDNEIMKLALTLGLPKNSTAFAAYQSAAAIRAVWVLLDNNHYSMLKEWVSLYLHLLQQVRGFSGYYPIETNRFVERAVVVKAASTHNYEVFDYIMDNLWQRHGLSSEPWGYRAENTVSITPTIRHTEGFVQQVLQSCMSSSTDRIFRRFISSLHPIVFSPANTEVRRGGALVAPASDDTDFSGNRGGGVRRGDGCKPSISDDTDFSGNRGGGVYTYLQQHTQTISTLRRKRTARPLDELEQTEHFVKKRC